MMGGPQRRVRGLGSPRPPPPRVRCFRLVNRHNERNASFHCDFSAEIRVSARARYARFSFACFEDKAALALRARVCVRCFS